MAFETIATGTPMHFRITLYPDASAAQVGLALYALSDLIQENSLGGLGRIDCGRFRVDQIKLQLGDSLGSDEVVFENLEQGADFSAQASSSEIAALLCAADEAIGALSMEEMQGYFTDFSSGAKQEKKAKAKAAVGAG